MSGVPRVSGPSKDAPFPTWFALLACLLLVATGFWFSLGGEDDPAPTFRDVSGAALESTPSDPKASSSAPATEAAAASNTNETPHSAEFLRWRTDVVTIIATADQDCGVRSEVTCNAEACVVRIDTGAAQVVHYARRPMRFFEELVVVLGISTSPDRCTRASTQFNRQWTGSSYRQSGTIRCLGLYPPPAPPPSDRTMVDGRCIDCVRPAGPYHARALCKQLEGEPLH